MESLLTKSKPNTMERMTPIFLVKPRDASSSQVGLNATKYKLNWRRTRAPSLPHERKSDDRLGRFYQGRLAIAERPVFRPHGDQAYKYILTAHAQFRVEVFGSMF